jgi:SAM-dependent methyltransferase
MHLTSLVASEEFANTYISNKGIVVDVGGGIETNSLRSFYENKGLKYICVDIVEHRSVDITIKLGDKLPFNTNSIDYIICNSVFEHHPCFWMTFKEMTRIIKDDGYIYVNSPSSGPYCPFVVDNYRFYADAGQALAYYASIQVCDCCNNNIYPVKVIESFNILGTEWKDFCCVWKRVKDTETSHILPILEKGILEQAINNRGFITTRKTILHKPDQKH